MQSRKYLKFFEVSRVLRVRMTKSIARNGPRFEEEDVDIFLLRALHPFTKVFTDLIPRQETISCIMPVSR